MLACEHKYWSRLEQADSIPEVVPRFNSFDPFDDESIAAIDLDYPFWVKPVKAHSSNLGFHITDDDDLDAAIAEIRAEISGMGDAFDAVLQRVDLPERVRGTGGTTCLAERLVTGTQFAPEGSMHEGEFHVHGVFDMHKDESGLSFERLEYPASTVPEHIQQRAIDVTERFLKHIGFDNGCFNSEFMWDEDHDQLWLIEFNTRISQSHSELFVKVDGATNHQVAVDIALGRPSQMPHRQGEFQVAGQCMVFHDDDAVVRRIPNEQDQAELARRHPGAIFQTQVAPGDRLSELPMQDSYRHLIGKLYLGDTDSDALRAQHHQIVRELPFEFDPVPTPHDPVPTPDQGNQEVGQTT